MANKKLGFVPIYRSVRENWVWDNDEPFSKGQAWIDLLLSVNHEEKKIKVGCSIVTIKPGQMWTSYKKLAQAWGWSYNRVKRFIKMLESDGMIYVNATANGTSLTIVNWGSFAYQRQSDERGDERTDECTHERGDERTDERQTIMINNVNNDKELKKEAAASEPAPPNGGGEWQ